MFDDVVILTNDEMVYVVLRLDLIFKTIENCNSNYGENVSIKFGQRTLHGLTIVP